MKNLVGIITANYGTPDLNILTNKRTMASLPYSGRYRLIDFPLSNMVNSGINTIGLIQPARYRSIIDHVGSGKEWDLDKKRGGLHILPGTSYGIGVGNEKFVIRDFRINDVFFKRSPSPYIVISSASIINNIDYTQLYKAHVESGADITMAYKVISSDNENILKIEEAGGKVIDVVKGVKKGDKAFIECFIINRATLLNIFEWFNEIDYLDLFEALKGSYNKLNVKTFEYVGYSRCIFDVDSYFEGNMDLLKEGIAEELFKSNSRILTKVQDSAPTKYERGCHVRNSVVPAGCKIAGTVENSVIFRNVIIEKGAVVKNSIIMQNCVIKSGAQIEYAIIDKGNIIGEGLMIKGTSDDIFIKEKNE
ncbi:MULTISPECIES: glucose-1-phosphate adenylyltransferase subunit GlgD [Anaerofustis]|uniref:glucose-1-phosphate adenylyltransferase subunit GlgD n=1 Tax=Anaerofustis TaxID=264995 RepID=UPI001105B343|nr:MULTISPECIES: glucose-1-phosphate adenylyltransferase subunit GlgD [Anaerofustis]MCO8194779.1 glucose-1-phosphate adenylyltransferase subunit GlgD [Anaerofustis sp. NSJ-163]